MAQEMVTLDGKPVDREELKRKMQEAETKKGVAIVEVSTGVYKTRIQG
jgi:hypothetical protein